MKWTISHIPESNIIHIETAGKISVDMLNQMIKEGVETGELHNSRLFLVDHRKALGSLSLPESLDRPQIADKLGVPRHSRIAQVVSEENLEKFKNLEIITENRGYQLLIFTDIKLAKEWLSS